MPVFYLIRHAHAEWSSDEQRPLSARGQADALRLAELLKKTPIDRICSSPFLRARQTIAPLAGSLSLPVLIEPDLRERELGNPAGTADFFAAVHRTWQDPSFAHPRGESNAAAQRRGIAVIQQLQSQSADGHIVLSTHGNLLALILQAFDPRVDFVFWKGLTLPDIYALSFHPAGRSERTRLWQG